MSRRLYFEKMHYLAIIPTKVYPNDACWDLYSRESKLIEPFTSCAVNTGLRFEILIGEKLHVYSRSGLSLKGIFVANAPGVIDAGYVGELAVILYNGTDKPFLVERGNKIAQFSREIVQDDELTEGIISTNTERGTAGFGSSGI